MKRRVVSIVLALAMMLSALPNVFAADTAAQGAEFYDVAGTYYEAAAKRWAGLGVISGDGSGKFSGGSPATRAQVAKIIALALGYQDNVTATADFYGSFKDVVRGAWYVPYLYILNVNEVMNGDGAGKIRPNDNVTRQEFLVMLGRAAAVSEYEGALKATSLSGKDEVASWARGYVGAMIARGVIKGDSQGRINAKANVTRGEIVTIIDRLIKDYITEGGEYNLTGDGITVVTTSAKVNIKTHDYEGSVVVAEKAGKGNVRIDGDMAGALLINSNAQVTLNGSAESAVISKTAKGAYLNTTSGSSVYSVVVKDKSATVSVAGAVESAMISGGAFTVETGGKVYNAGVNGSGATLTVNGQVRSATVNKGTENTNVNVPIGGEIQEVRADGDKVSISGGGKVTRVSANGDTIAVTTPATEVTAGDGSKNVTVGNTPAQSGATVTGGGSGAVISRPTESSGNPTQPVINEQPSDITVRYMSSGEFIEVKVDEKQNNSYSYQWYKNSKASNEGGTAVPGAKTAKYKVAPEEALLGETEYWYCEVTAARGTASLKTVSEAAKVKYASIEDSYVNLFVFGGHTLGSYSAVTTLTEMFKESCGVTMKVMGSYTGHASTTSTYNIYELFTANARGNLDNYTFASSSVEKVLKETPLDYILLQTGKDVSLNYFSNKTQNIYSVMKIVKLASLLNPDVKVAIVAPSGHTTGFEIDFPRAAIRSHKGHVTLINAEAEAAASNINSEEYLTNKVKVAYVGSAFESFAGGDQDKLAKTLFRPDNGYVAKDLIRGKNFANRPNAVGAYLSAAVMYAALTGSSPVGLECPGTTSNSSNLDSESNSETALAIEETGMSVKELKFELQATAQKITFGTDAERASYKIEYYRQNADKTGYDLYKEEIKQAFAGVARTHTGIEIEDYAENKKHPDRVSSAEIEADGSTVFRFYYDKLPDEATLPEFEKDLAPAVTVKYATPGKSLRVEIDEMPGNTYTYQWYKNTQASADGAEAIEGATGPVYRIKADEGNLDTTEYYFATVTAKRKGDVKTATSTVAAATYKKDTLNIYSFGGYPAGVHHAVDTLKAMLEEKLGVTVNLIQVSAAHTATYNTYNVFEMFESSARTSLTNYTLSNANTKKAFETVDLDYAIIQTNRDSAATSADAKLKNSYALRKLAKLASDRNPDVQFILVAPYAHTVNFAADFTSGSVKDFASHVAWINSEAEDNKSEIEADAYLENGVKIAYVSSAFADFAGGNDKVKELLYQEPALVSTTTPCYGKNLANRASAAGAYLTAATVFATALSESPVGLTVTGVAADNSDVLTNARASALAEILGDTPAGLVFDLQAAAQKTALGTEPAKAQYKVEHYIQNSDKTGYELLRTDTLTGYAGKETTVQPSMIEDYYEDAENAGRVATDVISPAGDTVFKFWYNRLADEAIAPVFKDQSQSATVKYATLGETLFVTVAEQPGHTYEYQWYVGDSATESNAAAIDGATESALFIKASEDDLGKVLYYFCKVTAHRKTFTAESWSQPISVSFEKSELNVLIWGNHPVGSYSADQTLKQMIETGLDVPVNMTSIKLAHTSTMNTWNPYELFNSTAITDYTIKNAALSNAMSGGTVWDYVVIQAGRDYSMTISNRVQDERNCIRKLVKIATDINPNVRFVIYAPYGHTTGFEKDFAAMTGVRSHKSHVEAIDKSVQAIAAAVDADGYLKEPVKVAYVGDAFETYADGDEAKLANVLFRPFGWRLENHDSLSYVLGVNFANCASAPGAYLAAATLYAVMFGKTPVGLECLGSDDVGGSLDNPEDVETTDILTYLGQTPEELALDLQKAAETALD
ncbi:MAG: S-layer homology domain-containing protein [Clostridia bacterium]|nr:S-layer homology domain-containing protein [Clostridia bacterium]